MNERQRIIESHRKLIIELRAIEKRIEGMLASNDPEWRTLERERNTLYHQIEPLIEEYWQWIPLTHLSRCPYCNKDVRLPFDAIDLNGFWWMDRTQRTIQKKDVCEHFCLLLGAVNFNGKPVDGGLFECRPGPDVPFVIDRILKLPTMVAVISQIDMHCGYSAYPIAYFTQEPLPPRALTQGWTQKEYIISLPGGKSGWDVMHDAYDYNLKPWVKLKKLYVFVEGRLQCSPDLDVDNPLLIVQGEAKPQIVFKNALSYESRTYH